MGTLRLRIVTRQRKSFRLKGERSRRTDPWSTSNRETQQPAYVLLPPSTDAIQFSALSIISPPSPSRCVTIARAAEEGSSQQTGCVTPDAISIVSSPVNCDEDLSDEDSKLEEFGDTESENDDHEGQSDLEEEEKDLHASAVPLPPRLTVRPTIYEQFSDLGVDWCRYVGAPHCSFTFKHVADRKTWQCGITQRSQTAAFRPGPWGKRTMCK